MRIVQPVLLKFRIASEPCAYWSNLEHIVVDGACRCGKKFVLVEEVSR
jgi:hypothetical protein